MTVALLVAQKAHSMAVWKVWTKAEHSALRWAETTVDNWEDSMVAWMANQMVAQSETKRWDSYLADSRAECLEHQWAAPKERH